MLAFDETDIRSYGRWQPRGPLIATRCYKGGSAPQPESYQSQITGELTAKSQLAPTLFATEAQYDPMYAALNNQLLQTTLFGSPAGATMTIPTPGYNDAISAYNQSLADYNKAISSAAGISRYGTTNNPHGLPQGAGNLLPNIPAPVAPGISPTTTINLPASRGIVSLANQAGTEQRVSNIADWSTLSPAALDAVKASNPALANLIDTQVNQAQTNLGLGTNLSPSQMAQLQQTIRARQQGMLAGTGNAGTYGEALGISQYGQGLYQQRLQNAAQASTLASGYYTPQINDLMNQAYNPYLAIQQSGVQNSSIGPRLYGSDINAQNAYNTQYQGALSAYNAQQNNRAAMTSAGVQAGISGATLGTTIGLAAAGLL